MIIIAFFHESGKYANLRHPFMMLVIFKMNFGGRFFIAVLVIESSPGALWFGSLFIIDWMVPGVVKKVLLNFDELISRRLSFTTARVGPGFGENCASKVSANFAAFSAAEKSGPFGPARGWIAGVLFRSFLLSL